MKITVKALVNADIETVWNRWTTPGDITKWNFASEDWVCPSAENDLQVGGKFSWRMEAKDGSMGFDFEGTYEEVVANERIVYVLGDGRKTEITFTHTDGGVEVVEVFDVEDQNSAEMQQAGWQAILDNFKKHAEK